MHCHFDSTRMNTSALWRGILSLSMAKQLWILSERWFKNTALFLLNKNQFLILRMMSFFPSVSSYFCAIDLYISCSLLSLASLDCTTESSFSSLLVN